MNKKLLIVKVLVLFILVFIQLSTSAQTLELNQTQNLVISNPGFYPFSSLANNDLKDVFPTNPTLTLQFSNFLGSPCQIAPASDFQEIGTLNAISGNDTLTLNFSGAPPNVNEFGLSIVPQGGTCIFDLFITPPVITTSSTSTSTSGGIITGGGDDLLLPDSFTVFGGYLSDTLTGQLTNEMSNPLCGSSPFGIEPLVINGQGGNDVINVAVDGLGLGNPNFTGLEQKFQTLIPSETESFSFLPPENKKVAMSVYTQKLINKTDMTKIFLTAIFASDSESSSIMLGANRKFDSNIDVTLKDQIQNLYALAAVQHSIVSATMPWQLSNNGGYFITQGGGCLSPYCVIVEQGMIVVDPDGACTPEKLNKRRAGYKTFNPSKFFDPFPFASMTIQIPANSIVDPKHPLVSKVVRDNAYLILQPVPPKAKLIQQLKFSLEKKED